MKEYATIFRVKGAGGAWVNHISIHANFQDYLNAYNALSKCAIERQDEERWLKLGEGAEVCGVEISDGHEVTFRATISTSKIDLPVKVDAYYDKATGEMCIDEVVVEATIVKGTDVTDKVSDDTLKELQRAAEFQVFEQIAEGKQQTIPTV